MSAMGFKHVHEHRLNSARRRAEQMSQGRMFARLWNSSQLVIGILQQIVHFFEESECGVVPITPLRPGLEFLVHAQAVFNA
jgi:hypothetical protein